MARCLLLLPLLLTLAACSEPPQPDDNPPPAVRVTLVTSNQGSQAPLRFSGLVQAQQRATLTFQVSGVVRQRPVELGQSVAPGQVLAVLYNPALEPAVASATARVNELQTQLEQAQRERQRLASLHQRGAVSEQEMEQVIARQESLQASVATARAALQEARQLRDESTMRAPFAGQIERLLVEKDEFVSAGQPVLRLSSPQQREVVIRVPTHIISALQVGQAVPIWRVTYRQQPPLSGVVSEIAQSSAIRGELHEVRVTLTEQAPPPGEPVEVGLPQPTQAALNIPLLALMRNESGSNVFRVVDNQVERVAVQILHIEGETVRVHSESLNEGDAVIYAGLTRVTPGDTVELLP